MMKLKFKNGITRARAQAWGLWLVFIALWLGTVFVVRELSFFYWLCLFMTLVLAGRLILFRKHPRKIPVFNYHSVSAFPEWLQIGDELSLTPAALDRQLAYLKRHDYRSLFISETHEILRGARSLDSHGKYIALTFDDGYADNWIALFPLLKKYGMKATIFITPDFIADASDCRPTIEQFDEPSWNKLNWCGYLSWPELRAMQASGLVEIQSHGRTHARVFAGPELSGFVGPEKPNLWLLWNTKPDSRLNWWREIVTDRSLWGHPVFRQAPNLATRAWIPDKKAVEHILTWAKNPDNGLFAKPDWEQCLLDEWHRYIRENGNHGNYESREMHELRVGRELLEAREILEQKLNVKVNALCWPEDAFSEDGEKLARRAGYTVTVSSRHTSRNIIREAPDRIARMFRRSEALGFASPFWDYAVFILDLKIMEGHYSWYPFLFVIHRIRNIVITIKWRRVKRDGRYGDYLTAWWRVQPT